MVVSGQGLKRENGFPPGGGILAKLLAGVLVLFLAGCGDGPTETGLVRLTNNEWGDAGPSWSPDGNQIIFSSTRDGGDDEIYVMNADGSNQTRLTNNPGHDAGARWAPDGKRIAFDSNRDGNYEIYVMNSDGSNQIRLTNDPGEDIGPSWSPDGKRIAFSSNRAGTWQIYLMYSDGSGVKQLTFVANSSGAAWSPDGNRIAFNGPGGIYLTSIDGAQVTQLSVGYDDSPKWSPDGRYVGFKSSSRGCTSCSYVMNSDGSNVRRLIDLSPAAGPNWSPDGKRVVFLSFHDSPYGEIYVMDFRESP
jgi:TolB protein